MTGGRRWIVLKCMSSHAADSMDEREPNHVKIVDLPGNMVHYSPVTKLNLENAPFSAEEWKWLEQLMEWAHPPPSTINNKQWGSAPSASTAAGHAGSNKGKSVSVHTTHGRITLPLQLQSHERRACALGHGMHTEPTMEGKPRVGSLGLLSYKWTPITRPSQGTSAHLEFRYQGMV